VPSRCHTHFSPARGRSRRPSGSARRGFPVHRPPNTAALPPGRHPRSRSPGAALSRPPGSMAQFCGGAARSACPYPYPAGSWKERGDALGQGMFFQGRSGGWVGCRGCSSSDLPRLLAGARRPPRRHSRSKSTCAVRRPTVGEVPEMCVAAGRKTICAALGGRPFYLFQLYLQDSPLSWPCFRRAWRSN
jgi:hypothetical protein